MKRRTLGLILILFVMTVSPAFGSLVSTVNIDTAQELDVTWHWDETVPSTDTPFLYNWPDSVELQLYPTNDPDGFIGGCIIIEYVHDPLIGSEIPHWYVNLIMAFTSDQYGTLADSYSTTSNATYHLYFYRSPIPSESVISLTASTVPIPGGLGLMSFGFILLWMIEKYKRQRGDIRHEAIY